MFLNISNTMEAYIFESTSDGTVTRRLRGTNKKEVVIEPPAPNITTEQWAILADAVEIDNDICTELKKIIDFIALKYG